MSFGKFFRKSFIRSLFKDIQGENRAHFQQIESSLQEILMRTGGMLAGTASTHAGESAGSKSVDLIVSHNEICTSHGTGVLLKRMFGGSADLIHIRSTTQFGGNSLGDFQAELSHAGKSRPEIFQAVANTVGRYSVQRILCVPFYPDDVLTAIAAKEIFGTPMCLYLMDDQNISVQAIPDNLMKELIQKSDVRFAIGAEMRDAYEKKFGQKFWILPPQAPGQFINYSSSKSQPQRSGKTGVLLGNIWAQSWLDELRALLRKSGVSLDWFGNTAKNMLAYNDKELSKDGLHVQGFLDEKELQDRLQTYAFAVIPSPFSADSHQWLAALSLPSRLPYLMSTANIPIVAISTDDTPVADFVRRFDIGVVCDYDPQNFRKAVDLVCTPDLQQKYRANAANVAGIFSSEGITDWLWKSLEHGQPFDKRFENLFPRKSTITPPWIDAPAPRDIWWEFDSAYQALYRLSEAGFKPDFVIDVGCSTGLWSDLCSMIFPNARYILVDPLLAKYRGSSPWHFDQHPNFECEEAAVSNKEGTMDFHVSDDMFGSSLMDDLVDSRSYETLSVPVITLDGLAEKKRLSGNGLLKLDVQFAEHLALEGAARLLNNISVIFMELTFLRQSKNSKVFLEMLNLLDGLGYRYFDEAGGWRSPANGMAIQQDVVFMKKGQFESEVTAQ